jgi:hypothetical protein
MNSRRCLTVADRIHDLLLRELQEPIDVDRMVQEPLYARDVLLVCEALGDDELTLLARHFRDATAEADTPGEDHGPDSRPAGLSSGFSASRFLNSISSLFGAPAPLQAQARRPSRYGPRAWFGRPGGLDK